MIERTRLLDQLDRAVQRPLTWISAPAGYGKSVLVAQWCHRRGRRPVVWVDATPIDDDPAASSQLARALALDAGTPSGAADGTIASIAAQLSASPATVLVIDGCESPTLANAVVDLALAVEPSGPDRSCVIVTSRALPPPRIAGLSLRGQCSLVLTDDFHLEDRETAGVINQLIPEAIDESTAAAVNQQIDGWITGARLVGLSFRRRGRPSAGDLFTSARDAIESYVASEILARVTEDERRVLLLTASVGQPASALCEAMTGRHDAERLIVRFREVGLPMARGDSALAALAPLHPIREALDRIAIREMPDARTGALRKAAEWYSRNGRPFDAAWIFIELRAWDEMIQVLFLHMKEILESDQISRLAEIASATPLEVIRDRAGLANGAAYALRMDGKVGTALELLSVFEPYMGIAGKVIANITRSGMVSQLPDVAAALAYADNAIAACEELSEVEWVAAHRNGLPVYSPATRETYRVIASSYALLACAYGGWWDRGDDHLFDLTPEVAATLPQVQVLQRYGSRATYRALAGAAASAQTEATEGLTRADTASMRNHRVAADAHYALGESLRLMLRSDEAEAALVTSGELAEVNGRLNLVAAVTASRAHLAIDRGDPEKALAELEAFHLSGARSPLTPAGMLAAAEARAHLALGDTTKALRALERAPWTPATGSTLVTTFASLGQINNAAQALQRWPDVRTTDSRVRGHLADAVVHEAASRQSAANRAFAEALQAAAAEHLLQPFIESGAIGLALLRRVSRSGSSPAAAELAAALRSATIDAQAGGGAAPLTAREATILAQLADGRSAREIGESLHLSIHTVKTHLRSVYRKLGVPSRAEAVRAYQQMRRQPNRARRDG